MHNEDVTEERRKREDKTTAKIDATEVGRYKRHNTHNAQANKEVAKSKAKASSKVVAKAQTTARKLNSVQAL